VEPFSNQIGYVMQEDALLGTLTPRECFQFACNLRVNQPDEDKHRIVEDLIS
jgi:ABC-type multidrug transport system ATPase subunit